MGQLQRKGIFRMRDTARARELRNAATPAERLLWQHLSRSQLGVKFSRQMPVGPYFTDFLCRSHNFVIEVDGWSHDGSREHDLRRDAWLRASGYRVLRFTNADVLENVEGVVAAIRMILAEVQAHPRPLPQAGGE